MDVTDGEFRRGSFHGEVIEKSHGVEFKLRPHAECGESTGKTPFVAVVSQRPERPAEGIEVNDYRFINAITKMTAKQTIPSPTMMYFRGGRGHR